VLRWRPATPRRDDVSDRDDQDLEERKLGVGTGETADPDAERDDPPSEAGTGSPGGDPHSGDPTGAGRPLPDDNIE
jgi:hypothetical protein